jgi:gluconokinase
MLNERLLAALEAGRHPVLACSALKAKYRTQLLRRTDGLAIIHLKGSYDLIWSRISAREGHYMKAAMLHSQFAVLEEPKNALVLDVAMPLGDMLDTINKKYFVSKRSSK